MSTGPDTRGSARLAAIVPATNAPATLDRCLEAVRGADAPPEELIVVSEPPFAGPALARNLGARRATADVLVFVDADVLVHPDAFVRIREAFAADPGLSAAFGSYDDSPPDPGVVSGFRNLLHHHVHQTSAGPAGTFWAGLGAIRREAYLAVGGFDEKRFPDASVEDIELGMRLAGSGARIELDPCIQGTHLKAWSLHDMVRTDFSKRGVPWVGLLLESHGLPAPSLNLAGRHRLGAVASVGAAAALAARRPAAFAACMGALVVVHRPFYALLARRRGRLHAAAGVGLHALHHLTAAAAVPAGILGALRGRRFPRDRSSGR